MFALYFADKSQLAERKTDWLHRFSHDGFWLLDVADRPLNKLKTSERRRVRRSAASDTIARISLAQPSHGVIVCHGPTFEDIHTPGIAEGLRFLHTEPIPFPLGNHRATFANGVRTALQVAGLDYPRR